MAYANPELAADILPLRAVHHIELFCGNAKQSAYFYRMAFGFSLVAYRGPETGQRDKYGQLIEDRLYNQLRQNLSTWSGHVKSWTEDSGLPLLVMRYEDMKAGPVETFARAVSFLGLNFTLPEIEAALERASFARLKQQEEEKGFSEKSAASPSFFRKGDVGDWKNVLTREQVNRIVEAHGEVMERFGYLED